MIQKLNVDFSHSDERGSICQILSVPNSQVNYLFTKAGAKRGKQYHKINKEYFYVINGRVHIHGQNILQKEEIENHEFGKGDLFVIEPYCTHELESKEDTEMIAVYDHGIYCTNDGGGTKHIYFIAKNCFVGLSPFKKNTGGVKLDEI